MTRSQKLMMKKKIQLRRSQSGAALVEGALLFPVMVLFLVYLTYFNNIHKVEMSTMAEARRQAWDLASHGCVAGANGGTTSTTDSTSSNSSNAKGGQTGTVMKGVVGYAKGTATGRADEGGFPTKITYRPIVHDVYVPCNENVNASASMFAQMYDLAVSMGRGIL